MEVSIKDFRNDMATPINKVAYGGERVILTRHDKGTVALVSLDDLALLEAIEDEADLKAALKARKEKGSVRWESVKKKLAVKRAVAAEPVKG